MNIIGLQEVVECNQVLEQKNLYYRIHLKDACGKQSLWIEPMSVCHCEEQAEDFYQCLNDFFERKGYTLAFSEDKLKFWIV